MQGLYAILKVQKRVDILGTCLFKTRKKREKKGEEGRENTKQLYDNLRCIQNQNQNIYCPSIGLQGNLSYGAQ